jgi:hypothetical protein
LDDEQLVGLAAGGAALFMMVIWFALLALFIASGWKVFTKAGQPGWGVLVPIYNALLLVRIVGRPDIWVLFCLIPLVSIVIAIILTIDLAKSFGKDTAYAIGLIILPIVFLPMLGFGSARYVGPAAATAAGAASPGAAGQQF